MKKNLSLSKNLFWDVDVKSLDYQKHSHFIIERVLNYGDKKDYEILKEIYGLEKIKNVALKANYISKRNINFWSVIFNIPLKSFKCTKKFSTKKQNFFWIR